MDLFLDALVNVRRELKFFEDVSQRYELDLSAKKESVGVKRYKELFVECSRVVGRTMMLEAMVLLWGTEKVRPYVAYLFYLPSFLSRWCGVRCPEKLWGKDQECRSLLLLYLCLHFTSFLSCWCGVKCPKKLLGKTHAFCSLCKSKK